MVTSPRTFSATKESKVIFSSSENLTPLSIKRPLFHKSLDSGGQSYKNVTHKKKKPHKYKKASASNKVELGYADESGYTNNWFDSDSDFTIGNVSISYFDAVWVLRGDVTIHVGPP